MSETNKVILAAVLGILVGFGGGRLLENRSATLPLDNSDESSESTDVAKEEVTKTEEKKTEEKKDDVTKSEDVSATTESTPVAVTPTSVTSGTGSVVAGDQKAGTIVLASYTVDATSWVVVHEDRAGAPGNVLGARRVTKGSGTTEVMLLRGTVAGSKYYVMLHSDDGDGAFDLKKDLPISVSGSSVVATFLAK